MRACIRVCLIVLTSVYMCVHVCYVNLLLSSLLCDLKKMEESALPLRFSYEEFAIKLIFLLS